MVINILNIKRAVVALTMMIAKEDLASYDETAKAWVVAPGEYTFMTAQNVNAVKGEAKLTLK